jgi:hypothetical protein
MRFLPTVLFAAVLLVAGCAGSLVLSPAAQRIVITTALPAGDYDVVGEVSADAGHNFQFISANLDFCRDTLKQQAAQQGASLVVLTTQAVPAGCPNCVSLRGNAYRQRAAN